MDLLERNSLIVSLYNEGLYPIAIRAKTGVSLSQIYRILRAASVPIRDQAESHRRHQMDFTFFECIDSHVKAQALGFIAADGCVTHNTVSIKIAHADHAYLEWMKGVVGYTGDVRVYASQRPNEQPMSHLTLCSPKMVADITRLGCGPRKSLTLGWPTPDQVPPEFLVSYALGYFEGDGSLSSIMRRNRPHPEFVWTVAGTESSCKGFSALLGMPPGVGIVRPSAKRANKIHVLRLNGNRQIKRVMDLLYAYADYTLARKRHQYDLLCAQLDHLDKHGWTVPSRRKLIAV